MRAKYPKKDALSIQGHPVEGSPLDNLLLIYDEATDSFIYKSISDILDNASIDDLLAPGLEGALLTRTTQGWQYLEAGDVNQCLISGGQNAPLRWETIVVDDILTDDCWNTKGDLLAAVGPNQAIIVPSSHATDDVLVVDDSELGGIKWKSLSSMVGVANDDIWDHNGDIAVGLGINKAAILTKGAEGQLLKVDASSIVGVGWADETTIANDPIWDGQSKGALAIRAYHQPEQGAGYYYTAIIPIGATDEVLTVDPNTESGVSWKSIQSILNITNDVSWQAKGDLIVGTGNSTAQIFPLAEPGKILSVDSNSENVVGVKWITAEEAFSELPIDAVSTDSIWSEKGDILIGDLVGETPQGHALPIGEAQQVLTVSGDLPAWEHVNLKTLVDWGNTARGTLAVGINRPMNDQGEFASEQRAELLAAGDNGDILTVDDTAACRLAWKHLDAVFSVAADQIWDAAGDIAIGTNNNAAEVLHIGPENSVLTVTNGSISWEPPVVTTTVINDTIWNNKGDIAVGDGNNSAAVIHVGTDGQHLISDSTAPNGIKWASPNVTASIAEDIIWNTKGDIAVGAGDDIAQILSAGDDGKILRVNSEAPLGVEWDSELQLSNDPLWSGRHNIAVGHRIFSGTTDDGDPIYITYAERLPIGSPGQVLSVKRRIDSNGNPVPDAYGSSLYLGYDFPSGVSDIEQIGDLIVGSGLKTVTRLPISQHPNYVLTVDPTSTIGISWKPFPEVGGIAGDDIWTAKGDLIVGLYENQSGVLNSGDDGQILMVDSSTLTGLTWKTIVPFVNDSAWAMKGDLMVATADKNASRFPVSNVYGRVLISNPIAPHGMEWSDPRYISTIEFDNLWNAKGDIAVGVDIDTSTILTVGNNGEVLTVDSEAPLGIKWAPILDVSADVTQNTADIATLTTRVDDAEANISANQINITNLQNDVGNATRIQMTPVTDTPPTDGQVLKFNNTTGQYEPDDVAIGLPEGSTGDIPIMGATEWETLSPGTAGYYLKSQGPGNPLVWAAVEGGGDTSGGSGGIVLTREREGDIVKEIFMYHRVPKDGTISSAIASLGALPGGQSVLVDVRKNGTNVLDSIFVADQPIQIEPDQAATNGIYQVAGTLDAGRIDCVAGDVIFICVLQTGTTNPGQDLQVQVVF